tara:strand:+ start:712 stop:954 length:243 start_codon:yes stop_codon:yes gene_type:complete
MAALANVALANTVTQFVDRFNELNTRMTSLTTADGELSVANTNITGDTLLVSANTNISGTLKVNGTSPDDNALAYSIALG